MTWISTTRFLHTENASTFFLPYLRRSRAVLPLRLFAPDIAAEPLVGVAHHGTLLLGLVDRMPESFIEDQLAGHAARSRRGCSSHRLIKISKPGSLSVLLVPVAKKAVQRNEIFGTGL